MTRPLVVLDTETATLRGAPHLIELGAIRVDDGEVVETFERLVRPEVPIEPDATAIHGITDEDVRSADPAPTVLAEFAAWAGRDWLAAHNAPFDARVLAFEYARAGLDPPPGPFLDTLKLARRHLPDSPDHRLETLRQMLELEEGPAHRALPDAVYCWQVLEAIVERRGGGFDPAGLLTECGAPLTIPASFPAPPRLPRRLRPLAEALRAGGEVTILYGEDETAPAPIALRPRFLYASQGKGYLEAECLASGTLKTYRLDRVRRVLSGDAPLPD